MELTSFKAAIIKRSRNPLPIEGGRLFIYPDVTMVYPDGKSELFRNVLMSEFINSQIEMKKPYHLFMVPITLPVSLIQNGFFIARRTQCLFAFYDGREMREDVKVTLKHIGSYRGTVIITALIFLFLGGLIASIGGFWVFVGLIFLGWFFMVLVFALMLSVTRIEDQMMEAVDLDRLRLDQPPMPNAPVPNQPPPAP